MLWKLWYNTCNLFLSEVFSWSTFLQSTRLTWRKLLLRAAAASARLPVSLLARLPAQLLTRSAKSNCALRNEVLRDSNVPYLLYWKNKEISRHYTIHVGNFFYVSIHNEKDWKIWYIILLHPVISDLRRPSPLK